jgi:beta-lactamase class A
MILRTTLLAAAAVLARTDRGQEDLQRRIVFSQRDLVSYSPATSQHIRERTGEAGMSVAQLCKAAITLSDNTAANLLFDVVGGPPAVTAFLRAQGDSVTRSDRLEPELNSFAEGDPRDTTTPAAMAATLQRLVLGDALAPGARQQLADWLIDNETGDACLRAGLGARWRVGDKTGSNGEDARNDTAVLWPMGGGAPWVITAYLQAADISNDQRASVLAQVGRIADRLIG